MPIPIACPNCKNPINAPETAAGKTITCWKCSTVMSVPIPDADIVDEPPRRATKIIGAKSKPSLDGDDDLTIHRKTSKKSGVSPVLLLTLIGGGVLLLGGVAMGGYLIFGGKKAGLADGFIGAKAPPGYSSVGDSGCGCRLFLPGNGTGNYARIGPNPKSPINPNLYLAMSEDEGMFVASRTPGFQPGTNENQFMKAFNKMPFLSKPRKFEIANKKMITVAGKPALQFTMIEKPDIRDDTPKNAEFFKVQNEQEKERVAKEGKRIVMIVTAHGEWSYVISLTRKLEEPSPDTIKTVLDSVTFL
jgi:hypothetical protein